MIKSVYKQTLIGTFIFLSAIVLIFFLSEFFNREQINAKSISIEGDDGREIEDSDLIKFFRSELREFSISSQNRRQGDNYIPSVVLLFEVGSRFSRVDVIDEIKALPNYNAERKVLYFHNKTEKFSCTLKKFETDGFIKLHCFGSALIPTIY